MRQITGLFFKPQYISELWKGVLLKQYYSGTPMDSYKIVDEIIHHEERNLFRTKDGSILAYFFENIVLYFETDEVTDDAD